MSDFFARRRSSGDSFIISHPVRFVKRFFESFLNFFLFLSTVPVAIATVLSATSLLYHFRDPLSSGFLNFFQVFCHQPTAVTPLPPSPRQPRYYIISASPCQDVFGDFPSFQPLRQKTVYSQRRCILFCIITEYNTAPKTCQFHRHSFSHCLIQIFKRQTPVRMRAQNPPIIIHIFHIFITRPLQ